nr:MAG TPA: hypothetical protein [Caudoviricetes sp.]
MGLGGGLSCETLSVSGRYRLLLLYALFCLPTGTFGITELGK